MSICHTAENNVQTQLSRLVKLYVRSLQVHMEESIFTQFELKEQHPLQIYMCFLQKAIHLGSLFYKFT